MKQILLVLLFSLTHGIISAQDDSIPEITIPNEEYAVYKYDSTLLSDILIYQYADLWDIDNDEQNDSIEFIGNGGAHTYFHLRIWLSSKRKWRDFPTFYIDFPYPSKIESLEELNESNYPQLVVKDFDDDNADEIYLNLDNPFASIPTDFFEQGVTSKQILIDYRNSELIVMDFKK